MSTSISTGIEPDRRTIAQAIESLRARIRWLEERSTGRGHRGFEEEAGRLRDAVAAFDHVLAACRRLDAASSTTIDGDDGSSARFVPRSAWQAFRRDVGLGRQRAPRPVPADPSHPLFHAWAKGKS